jgi:hypothetical protein
MTRIRTIAAFAVMVALLALPSVAGAIKIKSGNLQLTVTPAATNALSANHLTLAPLAPATVNGSTWTFPSSHGRIRKTNFHGAIAQRGGFTITNGTKTIHVREPILVSRSSGVDLFAFFRYPWKKIRSHGRVVSAPVALRRVGNVRNVKLHNGTATGTLRLSQFAANGLNILAGKKFAHRGTAIGTLVLRAGIR